MLNVYDQHIRHLADDESFNPDCGAIVFYLDAGLNGYGFTLRELPDFKPTKGFMIRLPDGLGAGAMRNFLHDNITKSQCEAIARELVEKPSHDPEPSKFSQKTIESFEALRMNLGLMAGHPTSYVSHEKRVGAMPEFRYALHSRPLEAAALPRGWIGHEDDPRTRFGVVTYAHPLPTQVVASLELCAVVDGDTMIREVIKQTMPKLRQKYAEANDPKYFKTPYEKAVKGSRVICLDISHTEILEKSLQKMRQIHGFESEQSDELNPTA